MGLLLVVAGLAWPMMVGSSAVLTEEQATEYYEAHRNLEKAAAEAGRRRAGESIPQSPEEANSLDTARQRVEAAKESVETAKAGPKKLAFGIKVAGAVLVIIGFVGMFARRS